MIDLLIIGFACLSVAAFAASKDNYKTKKQNTEIKNQNEAPT
jgi:hypothetical protein